MVPLGLDASLDGDGVRVVSVGVEGLEGLVAMVSAIGHIHPRQDDTAVPSLALVLLFL